ncbi:hypothetical protein C0Q70_06696 [Pomacea canaliculata]|uniref:G-protein coupled receptors family 1 profile domain-containing protein n=1 Tax=Pomacea canaliculata TaxID=400727 RepID=A0A2T7PCZ5_POMCA|nr:uncharacterized protein LOC112561396 [Pomacea canaliculata]PVD31284.1 hypothetical protein C0Q70_06696 [Pomacea canaliculata]
MEGTHVSTDVYNDRYGDDYVYRSTESYYIDTVGCIPVALLGIVGNLVSLLVWNSQTTYSATILLFKYLAVWDTAYLVSFIPVSFVYDDDPGGPLAISLDAFWYLTKLESVHTTLLIAFTRWLAVHRPVHVHTGSLLTRRHVVVSCLVVLVWCLAISAVFMTFNLILGTSNTWVLELIIINIVGLAVPVLPLVVFNLLTIKKIRSSTSTTSSSEQRLPTSRTSNHSLTITIMSMSVLSVVAYTIGKTVMDVYWLRHWSESGSSFTTLQSLTELLQVVNSSVNIIFYFSFSRKFRSSFKNCFVRRGHAGRARREVLQSDDRNDFNSSCAMSRL